VPVRRRASSAGRLLARGEALYQEARLVDAMNHGRAALQAGAGLPAHLLLGKVYVAMERYPEALSEYEAALRLEPRNAAAVRGRSLAAAHVSPPR
jgi:tetratricopeptide (TPR) repeat protein